MSKLMTKEEFIQQLIQKQRTDVVLLGDYINTATKTLFGCTKETCGHQWLATPNHITIGRGCPVCAGKKIDKRVNSVAALRPDLIKYFENPDDAYNITPGSHKKVNLICPDCCSKRSMVMYNLSFEGFSCKECSDHISYPNRLIRSIMNQFKNELDYLEYEWSDRWTNRRRYDVYFEKNDKKYIIEMHGGQHYVYGWKHQKTLEDVIATDTEKETNAISHNITPIIIDARISDFDFIFNNIKNSALNELFDLSMIDVEKSKTEITNSIIRQVCDSYQNDSEILIKDIANEFNISKNTVTKYLKIGDRIGWCKYTPGDLTKTKIRALDCNRSVIGEYVSVSECARELLKKYNTNFCASNISRACTRGYSYHGLYFEYI